MGCSPLTEGMMGISLKIAAPETLAAAPAEISAKPREDRSDFPSRNRNGRPMVLRTLTAQWHCYRASRSLHAAEAFYRLAEETFGGSYDDALGLLSPTTYSPAVLLQARRAYRRAVGA